MPLPGHRSPGLGGRRSRSDCTGMSEFKPTTIFGALGEPELGALLICEADFDIAAVGGSEVSLDRAQTIMNGAPSCPFRYRFAPR
jgi:hypothetical protein